ncbi:cytochrome P450 [Neofusicoccum parvum]|uniref:Cytochrome P450 n=1 Tax=Neofusicoccum parvum TaxID=310453 RepID=A0ACB5RU06_9PEZI|nr:cytochrome P450 [Neofusicoccum parvum]
MELSDWVKKCPDLDHQSYTAEAYFAGYPGFEGETAVADPNGILISVVKNKLSQNPQNQIFYDMISEGLQEAWTENPDWHDTNWAQDVVRFIGLMSSAVFAGPELAHNAEWQRITTTYTLSMFQAVKALRNWPAWTRPLVHWFLPECRASRQEVSSARRLLAPVLERRARAASKAAAEGGQPTKHEDTIAWMDEAASGRPYDPVAGQLGMAMAAIMTTSQLLQQALLDICSHAELIAPLRSEAAAAVGAHGWTTAGLFHMQRLDSCVKESQRLNSLSAVNLERKAVRDVALPDGRVLRRGTNVAVSQAMMRSPAAYADPDAYDGLRFYRLRQSGGRWASAAALVSTSAEHFVFGMGKAICPGRFFAANEVKVALAVILLRYDVRLKEGYEPRMVEYGFDVMADPAPKVEVRLRR